MARIRATDVVFTGAAALTAAPGAAITPARWVGNPARLSRMDRLCALALVACDGALGDAALAPAAPEWNGERTAIVLGTAYGCHATNEDYYRGLVREGTAGASPRLFAYTLPSSPVGEISIHYGVRGPTLVLANGLASGVDALAEGVALVAEGRADRALVCAAEVATPLLGAIVVDAALGDAALVDAAAAIVVERAADAAARGATPRGRLVANAAAFAAGDGAGALRNAAAAALAAADVAADAVRRLDAAAAVPGALGAAALVALARALLAGERDALILVSAGDDGGAASAAVVVAG
jgi:3-oxoacyl-[acyl-carrier-protein] synthase II